jgi:hypothetical protein
MIRQGASLEEIGELYSYNKVIYLAADSLQRDARTGRSWNICKIHESRDMYWAAASDFYNYGRTGFDLKMIVESIGSEGPIISKMERFIKSVTRPLERTMADSKRFDPKTYAKFEVATRTPLQIVFIAIESGEPTFAITTFRPHKVKGRITLTPERYSRSPLTPVQSTNITGLGSYELALGYFQAHQTEIFATPVTTIQKGMRLEVVSGYVGEPFSILRFDANGPIWAAKGECK